ncbi:hypothetical protein HY29_06700 [Hyphomonas beringensis]|uniref:Flagellin C-terminal domain-containing protein n=1 Tax=Hyphomonas beringensis TaxID=1280946 RepID=A0A062TT09_9PROT|nr:flagellin [Hyphomonas beringensis]KCZ51036.1 hypothetical protein HY29_06700 [Hyphomonas beringensis]
MDRFAVSSGLMTATLSKSISDLRQKMGTTSTEATTGRYQDLTLHMSGRIGKAMLGQKALTDLTTERDVLNLRASRLNLLQTSLTNLQDSSTGIAASMLDAIGTDHEVGVKTSARDAKAALDTIFSSLNVRYGERFLFSGDATASQPFPDPSVLMNDIEQMAQTSTDTADFQTQLDTYFESPTGGWFQNVFKGSPTASDPESISADHGAIKSLITNLAVLAASGPNGSLAKLDGYKDFVQTTSLKLTSSETGITDLRADLGVFEEQISTNLKNLETEETLLTEAFNQMTARDEYEAATELESLQTMLEASYLITARLSKLSLTNYLG